MSTEHSLPDGHPTVVSWRTFQGSSAYKHARADSAQPHNAARMLWPIYQAGWDACAMRNRMLGGRDIGGDGFAWLVLCAGVAVFFAVGFVAGRVW